MNVSSVELYSYNIPIDPPINIKNRQIINREGFLIVLKDKEGFSGIGEIAPLPGFQEESVSEFVNKIPEIRKWLIKKTFIAEISRLNGILSHELEALNLSPAVQFGVESALLQLSAAAHKKPIYKELSESLTRNIAIAGLIHAARPDVYNQVETLYKNGFRTIKIKVGSQEIEEDIKCIRKIYKLTDRKIKLRIDANRSWSIEEAVFFANEIKNCYPEFIEEPINDPQLLIEFVYITRLPVGLDESLSLFYPDVHWAKALVLKPAVIGSLDKVNEYIQFANQTRKLAIISDTYLTAAGLCMELSLAAALIHNPVAMGFGTYRWLMHDVIPVRIFGKEPMVNVVKAVSALRALDLQKLTRIEC
jgi:o-succinylbenzoate synthase